MNLNARDELGHDVTTTVFVSEADQVNSTSKVLLDDILYVLSPNETVLFSFHVREALYNESKDSTMGEKRKIQFVDPYSTLINGYSFQMELQTCHPGFKFSNDFQRCVCDTTLDAVQRYGQESL